VEPILGKIFTISISHLSSSQIFFPFLFDYFFLQHKSSIIYLGELLPEFSLSKNISPTVVVKKIDSATYRGNVMNEIAALKYFSGFRKFNREFYVIPLYQYWETDSTYFLIFPFVTTKKFCCRIISELQQFIKGIMKVKNSSKNFT
jgi:hypothetical protein